MPEGPWHPEDLAWMGGVVERCRDHSSRYADFAARVLAKDVRPEIVPLLNRLEGLGGEDTSESVEDVRAYVERTPGAAAAAGSEETADGADADPTTTGRALAGGRV